MEIAQLRGVLSDRLGQPFIEVLILDGSPAVTIEEFYEPMPEGFRRQLLLRDGSPQIWDLWQEDEETWNFSASTLDQA